MKLTFLEVGKERILLKLVQNLVYGLNMRLPRVFGIDQDIIQVYDNKDIQLFSHHLVKISLEGGRGIG